MQSLLLLRSEEENLSIKHSLQDKFHIISCPIVFFVDLQKTLKKETNIIITSKFASKIVNKNLKHKANIYIVGEESANIFKNNKLVKIAHIAPDASSLEKFLFARQIFHPNDSYVYYSGNNKSHKFTINNLEELEIYNSFYLDHLPEKILLDIENVSKERIIDYALIFSSLSAINFIKLQKKHNIAVNNILCLSEKIKNEFDKADIKNAYHCSKPSKNSLIDLLLTKVT